MYYTLMSGSCHLDTASNDEFSVECLFWFLQPTWKSYLKIVQITKIDLFWVTAPVKYFECAPNCKTRLKLKKITITNIWHSTPISTFDALSKWHEPDINAKQNMYVTTGILKTTTGLVSALLSQCRVSKGLMSFPFNYIEYWVPIHSGWP